MSGTFVGIVDSYHNLGNYPNRQNRNTFVVLYNFMQRNVAVGNATLHASNYGSGGTGFGYYGDANEAGENAWAVFKFLASASSVRTTDFYVLIQWADTSAFGASPGDPGSFENGISTDGVGIMMAYREDGGDPWNGTTNANGADTKGTPVWAGAGLHVLSKYNETGARSTNKEDLTYLWDVASNTTAMLHIVGDADAMFFVYYGADITILDRVIYLGAYTPRDGLVIPNPYVMTGNFQSLLQTTVTSGDSSGIMGITESRNAVAMKLHEQNLVTFYQPADVGNGYEYVEVPIMISRSGGDDPVEFGWLGHLNTDIVQLAYNQPLNAATPTFNRAYLGNNANAGQYRFSVKWGSSAPPSSGRSREGIVF